MPPIQSVCCACRKIVDDASPVLPHMGAYVCAKCAKQGKQRPIKEAEISNKVLAPWADSELAALIEYQASDVFLPFICAEGHRLVARKAELVCLQCSGFRLRWTYPWVLNGDWKKEL